MGTHTIPEPVDSDQDLGPFRRLLLDMARERSGDALLRLIVDRLAELPGTALARIWLMAPGDLCPVCRMASVCPDRTVCLHLVASAGNSIEGEKEWSSLDGRFRRCPVGVDKVGVIAARAEAIEVPDIQHDGRWILDPGWVRRERILGFAGQPLLHREQVLGVLAVFLRARLQGDLVNWLRMIATHAAVAIANARAFEEIERLRTQTELENVYLRNAVKVACSYGEIVGTSPALEAVLEQVALVGPTDAGVLILGESGTGKELIARAIHERSQRRDGPMITVNAASVPRDLFESEFFGHVRGASTGGVRERIGRFELADGGTLFLDEVGELPLDMQGKLLRVLQEGTFVRVGEERPRRANVRMIAATNRDLKADVAAGRFRQDLYYRLGVSPIAIPPLRERLEDIPNLAYHFMRQSCQRLGMPERLLGRHEILELQRYSWPGNVRELQNVIERAAITSRSGPLHLDLPIPAANRDEADQGERSGPDALEPPARRPLIPYPELEVQERANLQEALRRANWKISGPGGAAELLAVKPTTLASRLKAMGVRRPV
jgi:formate hydrogenlyase transcriptional activator